MEQSKELKRVNLSKNIILDVRTDKNEIDFEFILNETPIAFFKFTTERLLEVLKKGTDLSLNK